MHLVFQITITDPVLLLSLVVALVTFGFVVPAVIIFILSRKVASEN